MAPGPDIELLKQILVPVDLAGPMAFIYAYVPADRPDDLALSFLEALKAKEPARYAAYLTGMRMVGLKGYSRDEKWHMLDPNRPPKGIAKNSKGVPYGFDDIGEFKNIAHKSRIFHLREGKLFVLLTAYRGKKEDDLTADALNPAIYMRERFLMQRQALMVRRAGSNR